jgi:hypothetical protein
VRISNLLTASLSLVVAGSALVEAARVSRPPIELSRSGNDTSQPSSGPKAPDEAVLVLWLPNDLEEPNEKVPAPAQPTLTVQKHRVARSSESPLVASSPTPELQ